MSASRTPTTFGLDSRTSEEIPPLMHLIPSWMGLWFSIFPTVETLSAQPLVGLLVFSSYFTAQPFVGSKWVNSGDSRDSSTRGSGWSGSP
jgi:hypothetical protein